MRRVPFKLFAAVFVTIACLPLAAIAADSKVYWVGSWAASQQVVEPNNRIADDDLRDATVRQIVHLSLGGSQLRLKISNRYGNAPLHFTSVHLARAASPASAQITAGTDRAVLFSGQPDVIVPAGADYISDSLPFKVPAASDLAISLRVEAPPAQQTGHPGSRATSYVAHGDLVSAADLPDAKKVEHWYFIAGIDVATVSPESAVITLGDSITDGHGATTNGNDRWPDILARRILTASTTPSVAVLNHGIGGNRLLLDGLGPNALARFDHDVLAQAGARYLIVLEGINDIGTLARTQEVPQEAHDQLVRRMIAAYAQMIIRAHAHGISVAGATITAFVGSAYYHPSPASEADRQAVNAWIRGPGHFDAVIDFDKITRDPEHPDRLLPAFDSGDHLHPSPAGYQAMGNEVPLTWLGVSTRRKPASPGAH